MIIRSHACITFVQHTLPVLLVSWDQSSSLSADSVHVDEIFPSSTTTTSTTPAVALVSDADAQFEMMHLFGQLLIHRVQQFLLLAGSSSSSNSGSSNSYSSSANVATAATALSVISVDGRIHDSNNVC